MSEPTAPSPEPQNKQHTAQPGSQGSQPAQAYQSPQGIQPQPQGFQAPPRPFGGPGMNKEQVTPAVWVYEIAMGAIQALIGLVLVFTGSQFARFFGGGYGSSSGGDSAGVIFLLVGLALIVAGVSRPLKLR